MPRIKGKVIDEGKPFLVAERSGFPGLRIPLLSDEDCKARGIPVVTFPPFETWTAEQQDAGRKLADALMRLAVPQALHLILEEMERLPPESKINVADLEPLAAARAMERVDAGRWKPGPRETHGLGSYVKVILEMFASRQVSLLCPS